jgi:hypothetical protein
MEITVCGQPGTAEVIHRVYPQGASFHVKHDVAALSRLWIGRCIARRPSAPFHVKPGRPPSSTGVAHRLWIVVPAHVADRVVARETVPAGNAYPLPVDNTSAEAQIPLVSHLNGDFPERSRSWEWAIPTQRPIRPRLL